MKAEILLMYCDRPNLINNALRSIDANRKNGANFSISLIDDSSFDHGYIKKLMWKRYRELFKLTRFYEVGDTLDDKIKRGESIFGKYLTEASNSSESDYAVLVCDDDALLPNYINQLSSYYDKNPEVFWSWSYVLLYDYELFGWDKIKKYNKLERNECVNPDIFLNSPDGIICPESKKDSSQVSYRVGKFKELKIEYACPKTANLDGILYRSFAQHLGCTCHQNNIIGQFKGWNRDQLGNRQVGDAKFKPQIK